jgi:hypothetical protein
MELRQATFHGTTEAAFSHTAMHGAPIGVDRAQAQPSVVPRVQAVSQVDDGVGTGEGVRLHEARKIANEVRYRTRETI